MNRIKYLLGLVVLLMGCSTEDTLFVRIDPGDSNVHFSNRIVESEELNILEYEYIYNGGGIGLGDFNNDGLEDLFVGGNKVDNHLYLNRGDFKFEDVSVVAGIQSKGQWSSGIVVVDINNDGWQDVYVCNTTSKDSVLRLNNLYINQGLNTDGTPTFVDMAEAYNLADNSYSVNAAFFDYDNDKDLDLIIIVNEMGDTRYHSQFRDQNKRGYYQRVDRFYKNLTIETGKTSFENISEEAGITLPGFSLGVNISDINKDGWKDIYISNDFLSGDLIYVNEKDGTFREISQLLLKHTSHSAMGNDVSDLNNDGYDEIIALDMLPEDNYRQKRLLGESNYNTYINNERFGYSYQYVRNSLQLNNGIEASQMPMYSEISLFAGISATDWSWTPLVADFDQDGYRDIIITNGFPRDVTDHDFIDFKADAFSYASQELMLSQIPTIKLSNYAYKNNGDLTFSNATADWGLTLPTYSNGAAYGDLDNDGDLDFIVNNINDSLAIYQNQQNLTNGISNYLQIELNGDDYNVDAIGTLIDAHIDEDVIHYEHSVFRGYLSSHSKKIHLGLGGAQKIDRLKVTWPDGSLSEYRDVIVNQTLQLQYKSADRYKPRDIANTPSSTWLDRDTSFKAAIIEEDYIDYNIQPLLPHKLSQFGPSISVGDVDQNGLDDIYVAGSAFYNGYFIMQQEGGAYTIDSLTANDREMEELGTLLLDFDSDGDLDLFIVGGSYEFEEGHRHHQDRIFENVNGTFILNTDAIPAYFSNGTNVKACDYDKDGDLDMFICGRVITASYPSRATSYLLENHSTPEKMQFELDDAIPELENIGMVTDAIWSDYNNDGWTDLIVIRELGDIRIFKNQRDGFEEAEEPGLQSKSGFWNSISGSDLDQDGDIDYVLGNIGTNTYNEISAKHPYRIYVNDFDDNGDEDALPFAFFKDQVGGLSEYTTVSRMDFAKEINAVRKLYPSYKQYAEADVTTMITPETMKETEIWEANYPYSSILKNNGTEGFEFFKLPSAVQVAPVFGVQILDINGDGYDDIITVGNDFGHELVFGRMDASNGTVLINDGQGDFSVSNLGESGFYAPGDMKSLATVVWDDQLSLLSGENMTGIALHRFSNDIKIQKLEQPTQFLTIYQENKKWKKEIYHGDGFLSQSTTHIQLPNRVDSIVVTYSDGTEVPLFIND